MQAGRQDSFLTPDLLRTQDRDAAGGKARGRDQSEIQSNQEATSPMRYEQHSIYSTPPAPGGGLLRGSRRRHPAGRRGAGPVLGVFPPQESPSAVPGE